MKDKYLIKNGITTKMLWIFSLELIVCSLKTTEICVVGLTVIKFVEYNLKL